MAIKITEMQNYIAFFRNADVLITTLFLYDDLISALSLVIPGFKETDLAGVHIVQCVDDSDFTQFRREFSLKLNNISIWIT